MFVDASCVAKYFLAGKDNWQIKLDLILASFGYIYVPPILMVSGGVEMTSFF